MARPPDTSPGTIKNWIWFAFVVGVVGVVTGLWTQTEFAHWVGLVIGFLWQCVVVVLSSIPDVITAARDASG